MAEERWLIVGLGTPGAEYAGHRHNAGFLIADLLADRASARLRGSKFRASVGDGRLAGLPVTIAKPVTFMNESGGPVAALRDHYRLPADRLVVLHEDQDLPFGTIRLKMGGGDNGHNGLRSVSAALRTRDYHRLRFGIGRAPGRLGPAACALRDFAAPEGKELPYLIDRSADAVEALLADGLAAAQNAFHPGSPHGNDAP